MFLKLPINAFGGADISALIARENDS